MHLESEWLPTSDGPETAYWLPVFLLFEKSFQVKAGNQLCFPMGRPEFAEWTRTTRRGDNHQRQSTFLLLLTSPERLRKAAEDQRPTLSQRGKASQRIHVQTSGEISLDDLAIESQKKIHKACFGHIKGLRLVKDLAGCYV